MGIFIIASCYSKLYLLLQMHCSVPPNVDQREKHISSVPYCCRRRKEVNKRFSASIVDTVHRTPWSCGQAYDTIGGILSEAWHGVVPSCPAWRPVACCRRRCGLPTVLGPIYATKFANIVVRLIGDDFCASVIIDLITRRGFLSTFLEKYFEVKLDKWISNLHTNSYALNSLLSFLPPSLLILKYLHTVSVLMDSLRSGAIAVDGRIVSYAC